MIRTLIAALLMPFAGVSGIPEITYNVVAPFPPQFGHPSIYAPLVEGRAGGIYGIFDEGRPPSRTQAGGIFRVQNGECRVLHRFVGDGGYVPTAILPGGDGLLYGQTVSGGEFQSGVLWSFDPLRDTYRKLADITPGAPGASLKGITRDNRLFGVVPGLSFPGESQRVEQDALFTCTRAGDFQQFFLFNSLPESTDEEIKPSQPLAVALGPDDNFYGVTRIGGPNVGTIEAPFSHGVFFQVTAEGDFSILADYDGSLGLLPQNLVTGPDGNLYGMTEGLDGLPVLLRFSPEGVIVAAHVFTEAQTTVDYTFQVFVGIDGRLYAGASRTQTTAGSDFLLRYDTATEESELYEFVAEQRAQALVQTAKGDFLGATTNSQGRGIVVALRKFGFVEPPDTRFNRPPYARPDRATVAANKLPILINVLRNDGDVDGDTLTVTLDELPEHGEVTVDKDKRFFYTPNDDSATPDQFTYIVSDGSETGTASAVVSLVPGGPSRTYVGSVGFHGVPAYIRATITPAGQLTGVIFPIGRKILLRGTLKDGSYTQTVQTEVELSGTEIVQGELTVTLDESAPTGSRAAELIVDLSFNDTEARGTFEPISAQVDADPQYTISLPPFDPLEGTTPLPIADGLIQVVTLPRPRPANLRGAGWATLSVSENGYARLAGKLADGRAVSFGGPFSSNVDLPIYARTSPVLPVSPQPARGFIAGTLNFDEAEHEEAGSHAGGILRWTRPYGYNGGGGPFKNGFAIFQPTAGFRYKRGRDLVNPPPASTELPVKIELSALPGLGAVQSSGTADGPKFEFSDLGGSFTTLGPSGAVVGTVKHPQLAVPSPASGVVIRKFNQVIGFYQTPFGTGQFVIKPD